MSFLREPNAEPLPGYRLIEPLGSGGFGEVWKCEAPGGLFKAIKFVYGNLNSLDADGARAEQEFHALNRVKEVRHPFVLSTERIDMVDGELVIVMELADKSLHDSYVESQASGLVGIPRDALLRYLRDAAEALDHMIEKHNLQHLDIKPRNLFLVSDRVKVADFGLVKHLDRQAGSLVGATPLYAPPETFLGKISEHSDQYSLAIVYQELLTGQRPFTGKNARQLALQHMKEPPELRPLPEAERPVVARALSKDPAKRFPNCLAFVRALYMARTTAKSLVVGSEASAGKSGQPKTLAETMEDILLEQLGDERGTGSPAPGTIRADEDLSAPATPEEVSQLGMTVQQPDTGVLRPTLILGLGAFGRRALMELRCRFLDRFGDLGKIPLHHFLYIDSDPEAVKSALRGDPEVAYSANEVYHLPLQPMANYRRRMLDQLNEWLPREKLYTMPRSLQTQGSRALGRLAFADNHLRLLTRLRRELEQISHPDTLFQAVNETGLALRENRPRIIVLAAAGGGSSGLLVDLGYSLRRLLNQMRQPEAEITAFVFCGAPEDPATPAAEQANLYATLTELNHFSDENIHFAAQYGADGPRILDQGQPFSSVYLLKLVHRNPEGLRDAVAHLGSYLFHELTTPLGLRVERSRLPSSTGGMPFRSFGTYAVWFPRGLLLRLAGQRACYRLLQEWQAGGEPTALAEVEAATARVLADPELRFEDLCARIEAGAAATEGDLAGTLTALLSQLEDLAGQAVAQNDPGHWALQAVQRVQEWLGPGYDPAREHEWRKSRLGRALSAGLKEAAADWEQRLLQAAAQLMDHPGRRIAATEAALTRFALFCQEAAAAQRSRLEQQRLRTQQAGQQLEPALEQCRHGAGGFSLFGSRSRRVLR
ncbi:MAG: protein kinase, partial [Planctomycetes bacterium]|nr:protein kinase [Planctomycetota bacterium]